MRNIFQTNTVEELKILCMFNNFFPKIVPFFRYCGRMWSSRTCHR